MSELIPTLYYIVGLPGSGKSTYIENIRNTRGLIVVSSDKIRKELYGDENIQGDGNVVFGTLHDRIKNHLKAGMSVAYDATGINKSRRVSFLNEIKGIPCHKRCVCIMTPYDDCIKFNSKRERVVPDEVITRMYKNWQPPCTEEGFDSVVYYFNFSSDSVWYPYRTEDLFYGDCGICNFDQKNHWHSKTLGDHCLSASLVIRDGEYKNDYNLFLAALLHDIGKIFTASPINGKGEEDGDWHYYNHNCVGAYDSLFYLNKLGMTSCEMQDISNLIYYHMHPYMSWKDSKKSLERDTKIMGQDFINRVYELHRADEASY